MRAASHGALGGRSGGRSAQPSATGMSSSQYQSACICSPRCRWGRRKGASNGGRIWAGYSRTATERMPWRMRVDIRVRGHTQWWQAGGLVVLPLFPRLHRFLSLPAARPSGDAQAQSPVFLFSFVLGAVCVSSPDAWPGVGSPDQTHSVALGRYFISANSYLCN